MTTQTSEELEIEHDGFETGAWSLYGVIRGEPTDENHGWGDGTRVYRADPGTPEPVMTCNWKGFTEVYRLRREGRLVLVRFRYDDPDLDDPPRLVNETLQGDFYLVLKSAFEGVRVYVPFKDGAIVLDRAAWLHERYTGASPVHTELRRGCHPSFPSAAPLWHEPQDPP